jgi:hypothetical protein
MVANNPSLAEAVPMIPDRPDGRPGKRRPRFAALLVSDDGGYISGATIPLDGGPRVPRLDTGPWDLSVFAFCARQSRGRKQVKE